MKRLVVTRADSKIQNWIDITHPIIKNYADRCNADFKVINNEVQNNSRAYAIFQLYELFDTYDRILQIDTDTVIMKDCPNLFDFVKENMIGTIYEDVGSRKNHRRKLIQEVQNQRDNVNWISGYINTGVFILSKEHREVLNPEGNLWDGFGYDDVEIGYRIHKFGFNVQELPYKFNHMGMFSEEWNGFHSRFNSNIIHYAGNGFNPVIDRFKVMESDYNILNKYGLISLDYSCEA